MKSANLLGIALLVALSGCKPADAPSDGNDSASAPATTETTIASPLTTDHSSQPAIADTAVTTAPASTPEAGVD
ncbi:MAG: hypothetical protein ACREP7_11195, partial [Lysobacter sp.]